MARIVIAEVGVQLESVAGKSLDEISDMEIFSHLSTEEQDKAELELLSKIEHYDAISKHIQEDSSSGEI